MRHKPSCLAACIALVVVAPVFFGADRSELSGIETAIAQSAIVWFHDHTSVDSLALLRFTSPEATGFSDCVQYLRVAAGLPIEFDPQYESGMPPAFFQHERDRIVSESQAGLSRCESEYILQTRRLQVSLPIWDDAVRRLVESNTRSYPLPEQLLWGNDTWIESVFEWAQSAERPRGPKAAIMISRPVIDNDTALIGLTYYCGSKCGYTLALALRRTLEGWVVDSQKRVKIF